MLTYLFAWNPRRWNWINLDDEIENVARTGYVDDE